MNFEAAINTINRDFCNLFLAKYLSSQWGIVVGFNTVPEYLAVMRKTLADWQLASCNNEWCDMVSTSGSTCPAPYIFVSDPVDGDFCSLGGCALGQSPVTDPATGITTCVDCFTSPLCFGPDPTPADLTIISYGTATPAGECVLNPPLQACRSRRGWGRLNVNEILIGTFTR